MSHENTKKNIRITARALLLNYERTHILLVQHVGADTYATPGGGLEAVDVTMQECLHRELQEELGVDIAIERLAFSREFVILDRSIFEFYFLCSLPQGVELNLDFKDTAYTDDTGGVERRIWVPLENINTVDVLPVYVKDIDHILKEILPYRHVITNHVSDIEKNIFL